MKKKLSITLLSLFTIVCMCFGVTADTTTPSVSYKADIGIIGGETDGKSDFIEYEAEDGCEVNIVLTPYSFRENIESEESKKEMEVAYKQVSEAEEVTDFAPVLKGYGMNFGIEDTCMLVSNIFDITTYVHEHGTHDESYNHKRLYNIQMTADSLKYFMALMHYDYDTDTWEIVPDAHVTGNNQDILTFTFDECSPFAIISCGAEGNCQLGYKGVKDTSAGKDYVAPSCHCLLHINGVCYCWILIILLVLSLIVNVYFVLKKRQDENDEGNYRE